MFSRYTENFSNVISGENLLLDLGARLRNNTRASIHSFAMQKRIKHVDQEGGGWKVEHVRTGTRLLPFNRSRFT